MSEDFDQDQHELLDAWVTTTPDTDASGFIHLDIAIALRGNLPTPAFAWPAQYVKKLAPEGGSALVSFVDGMLKIMYFRGLDEAERFEQGDSVEPSDSVEVSQLADHANSIDDIVRFLVTNVRKLVVIPDYRESYSSIVSHELPLLLFTAASPLAIQAAYSLLTRPVDSAKAQDLPLPRTDLVFFGSPAYEAEIAADRISKTARKCMQVEVTWSGYALRRMDSHAPYEDVDLHVGASYQLADFIDDLVRHQDEIASERNDNFQSTSEFVKLLKQAGEPESDVPADSSGSRYPESDPIEIESFEPGTPSDGEDPLERDLKVTLDRDELIALSQPLDLPSEREANSDQADSGSPSKPKSASGEPAPGVLLPLFPELKPITQRLPIDPAIECGIDASNRLHLLAGERQLRSLQSAALEVRRWKDLVVGSLQLQPFEQGGLQLDLLVNDPADSSDLQGTGLNLYWIDGADRLIALNNEDTARGH